MDPIYDKPGNEPDGGLGTRPASGAPGFESPKTYSHAPDIADSETAATKGSGSSGTEPNAATQQEQSAVNKGEGNNWGDMSARRSSDDNPAMKYTGSGEKDAGKKRGLGGRLKNAFSAANPNRLRNLSLAGGFGAFIAGIAIVIVLLLNSLPAFHLINAASYLMSSFGIAANQANETLAKIMTPQGEETTKTRLSTDRRLISKAFNARMKSAGVDFIYDSKTGKVIAAELDPSKNSELKGSESKVRSSVAERLKVSLSDVTIVRSGMGYTVRVNMKNGRVKIQEGIIRDFAARTGSGKITAFLVAHHFRESLGVPSLFHPFERAKAATQNAIGRWVDTKVQENERVKALKTKIDDIRTSMRSFFEANSGKITVARLSTSAVMLMCAVREISIGIEENNYQAVQAAQQSALDMIAQGNQAAYGTNSDATADQYDSAAAHMYGEYLGQNYSFFDSASIRARQGLPPITFSDSGKQQQYDFDRQSIQTAFSNVSPWQTAYDFTQAFGGQFVCTHPIQEVLTIADIGLTIGSAFATGGWGGAIKAGASAGVVMGAASLVMSMIVAGSTNQTPDITPNQGLLGGDYSSLGADSVANASSATAGAAKVSSDRAKQLKQDSVNVDLGLAKDQTLLQKLSPTNIYSPVAKLVNSINPSPTQNIQNMASSFTNIFMSTIQLPSTLFSAKAHAEDTASVDLETPTLALTKAVESKINSTPTETITSRTANIIRSDVSGYAARANACFGVKFLDSTDQETGDVYFDIQYDHTVDYYSNDYTSANCADEKDNNWVTISAGVHIITIADAATCRETLDTDACARTGMGTTTLSSTSTADTTDAIGEPNTSSGRAQGSWGGYSNGKISTSAMTKITPSFLGVSSSDTIQICNTKISAPYLNPSAAVSIKALNDAFIQKFGHMMYFQSCYREIGVQSPKSDSTGQWYAYYFYRGATPGTSNHGWGLAVDIGPNPKKDQGCDPGSSNLTAKEKEMCQWITDNAPSYGWKNGKDVVPSEQWHFEYSRKLPTGSGA